ncbi:sialate O-acetylesterase [Cellulosilyticum sp. I15G10I2]|uniref:sialate O-acetylesterase n=1 Tax=Cellulosilyticum sp. I15G10I2 TaxID=1892843 RepID=UPI00085BDE3C|nr:sialate O-acetylesterase [Cellulosilyticum sp. I15G10I2]
MENMNKLWFPRLISNGMILSNAAHNRLYGKSVPSDTLKIRFQGNHYNLKADYQGNFEITLGILETGGPYELFFISTACGEYTIKDVYVGETFVASGQSNMEMPMKRVRAAFKEEWEKKSNPMIRLFKVAERVDFHEKKEDFIEGEWVALSPETIDEFSAAAYFFGSLLYEETKVPIGIIQAAYGGTPLQAWLPKEHLLHKDLELLSLYEEDRFVQGQIRKNEEQEKTWYEKLDRQDFKLEDLVWRDKKAVSIPCFFKDFVEEGFCGSIWFKREFDVKKGESKEDWTLYLGTLVDADDAYINGVKVGHTDYKYPPRWYRVSSDLLREGTNQIIVRIIVNEGQGRWTPGKAYYIEGGDQHIDLSGEWLYQVGGKMDPIPPRDFIPYKPTGLHNGMLAPCFKYGISGFLWYQGESNTRDSESYEGYLKKLIGYIRESFKAAQLPIGIVQLANFDIDLDPEKSGWPEVREAQRKVAKALDCGLITTIDIGESNDLHPLDKKQVGHRLAVYMLEKVFHQDRVSQGPELEKMIWLDENHQYRCFFKNCSGGLTTKKIHGLHPINKRVFGEEIKAVDKEDVDGFVLMTKDLRLFQIIGRIETSPEDGCDDLGTIVLTIPSSIIREEISELHYAFENNPTGNLLCNKEGFIASPFRKSLTYYTK